MLKEAIGNAVKAGQEAIMHSARVAAITTGDTRPDILSQAREIRVNTRATRNGLPPKPGKFNPNGPWWL